MKKRYLFVGGVFLLLLCLGPSAVLFWQIQKLRDENDRLSGNLDITAKQLTESLQRASTERVKAISDLERFAVDNTFDLINIKHDLEVIGARLEAVASTKASTTTIHHNYHGSDSTTPTEIEVPVCPEDGRPIDIHNYTQNIQNNRLEDSNGMVVADVSFNAAIIDPWEDTIYGINYYINNTISRDEEERIILHTELLAENPEVQPGQRFRIEGVFSKLLQIELPPVFDFWDPSIFMLLEAGAAVWPLPDFSMSVGLGISIMSYGHNWRFIGVTTGLDFANMAFAASITPFLYNLGGPIPFIDDLWTGLFIGINSDGFISLNLGISTRL